MYDCSYQAMQIQEKNFYRFYKLTFPRKKMFVMALIKGEILILLFSPKTNKQTERTLAGGDTATAVANYSGPGQSRSLVQEILLA